jgi:hypothetical protein
MFVQHCDKFAAMWYSKLRGTANQYIKALLPLAPSMKARGDARIYSKTCLKRNAIVPVFFSRFHRFPFYKGLCFYKTKYKKYDCLGLQ